MLPKIIAQEIYSPELATILIDCAMCIHSRLYAEIAGNVVSGYTAYDVLYEVS